MDPDQLRIVLDFSFQGGALGLDQYDTMTAIAVELAIQSGDMPLPMSQEECEKNLPTGALRIDHVLPLLEKYPKFHQVARRWAYAKYPETFPMFWDPSRQ